MPEYSCNYKISNIFLTVLDIFHLSSFIFVAHMQEEEWSNIISSRSSFSLDSLKDVWHYRDLLWMFVKRDIVTNYKQTILGPLWFFIQPLLTTAMLVLVFGRIAKLSPKDTPQILFYLTIREVSSFLSVPKFALQNCYQQNQAGVSSA